MQDTSARRRELKAEENRSIRQRTNELSFGRQNQHNNQGTALPHIDTGQYIRSCHCCHKVFFSTGDSDTQCTNLVATHIESDDCVAQRSYQDKFMQRFSR